jgi:predicted amidohydrolase
LFIPTNNGLPRSRSFAALVKEARTSDVARAVENKTWIIRADVAGKTAALLSHGSSAIVDPRGTIVKAARELSEDLLIAEI